jgi:UTP--glucose-1-phosphate uridylyltransferase
MIRKAVIPAAGLGTRFLPATKAIPKEMLPVVDKPVLQLIVEEAANAGLSDLIVITGQQKTALEDHFDRSPHLEQVLREKGKADLLNAVLCPSGLADLHFIRQGGPLGLGHAVRMAERHVDKEPFAVMLGDDLIDAREDLLLRMMATQERSGGSVLALMRVDREQISNYGCAEVEYVPGEDFVRVTNLVEKPAVADAPSDLAVIGRYILHPCIFEALARTQPGVGGEIQLTDAIQSLISTPGPDQAVFGVIFEGRRFDTGDKFSYLKAVITLALEREDFGADLRKWLQDTVDLG